MKFKKKLSSLALALVIGLSSFTYSNAQQNLEAHFINVGQGDATYIELPNGTDILIDAGNSSEGSAVVNYLKAQEKNIEIDYLIATHPDADHIGGMQEVFKQLKVRNFYYPMDTSSETQTWKNVLSLAESERCKIRDTKSRTGFGIEDVRIMFKQPDIDYKDNNDDSAVVSIEYKDTKLLVTGDISATTESDMISSGSVKDVDVLKVAHHGSKTSSSKEFLTKVKAENAIISVGKENSYGHPNSDVLTRLLSNGSKVWRTDINGTIVLNSDGKNINITSDEGTGTDAYKGKWVNENGNWYYYKGSEKQTGWIKDGGVWYYLENNGVMATGWKKLNGVWYYLKPSGAMATGWENVSNKWYYMDSSGAMQTGWEKVDGTWYYLDSYGAMKTGWQNISNQWYYLKPSGAMATGWEKVNGTWYYLNAGGDMAIGWKQLGGTWYYLKPSGAMATGWEKVNNKWYYLESSGAMATGWKQLNGYWYYLNSGGDMATGWKQVGTTWYYLYNSGVMATNTTIDGWKINGSGVATPPSSNNGNNNNNNTGNGPTGVQGTVYITPGGKSYHNSRNCTALKRSSTVLAVSYSEAINRGKSDPCNLCVR